VERNPDTEAPAAPPSLRSPGEKLPTDTQTTGVMRPVQMPKPKPPEQPDATPDVSPQRPFPDAAQPGRLNRRSPRKLEPISRTEAMAAVRDVN